MIALPALTAVSLPLELTFTTDGSLDFHLSFPPVAPLGEMTGLRVCFVPSAISTLAVLNETFLIFWSETVTTQVAVLFLYCVLQVMVALPGATAVTLPFESTFATLGFDEVHVTVFIVVSAGVNRHESCRLCLTVSAADCLLNLID